MRKIILSLAVSLDSLIEGPNGEYDWCFTDQDYGLAVFMSRIDSLFIGRKSYDLMLRMAEEAPDQNDYFKPFKKYIFSHTLESVADGFELVKGDTAGRVAAIKEQPGKDIWLFGGAGLTTEFINEGWVDEIMLALHPLILGPGKPLFNDIKNRVPLKLTDAQIFDSGLVMLYYDVLKKNT